ncbi:MULTISPECIES: sugar phosphate isomerase/epimerase family protein [Aestuariimicrobium]|uniref:sugar phosphate isomerase/epimerase family protein n=1 Tax=Aestuariimicrobium TaxID=396388 RepID=UPI0003B2E9C1|nr:MULTISPECIES: sugar phosphate isomerase/epimerase [Aestuariimicrobium]CAI9404004.1 hypothetical protein AESSP_01120 [Aestuariimicrobium sp. T2.26MG-19.2B]
MKLGFLTACLPSWSLEQIADYAVEQGYQTLEVACWPGGPATRDFEASHIDVSNLDAEVERVNAIRERTGLEITSLAYYENNLNGDLERRGQIREHFKKVIDMAAALEVPTAGTFIGRDMAKSINENQREAERVFPEITDHAGEKGVKVVIENCVMEGWHPDGYPGNIAYSPELWEWMCKELGLFLNWDPSHLTWIGIDPVETIEPFAEYIVHAQAKDLELFPRKRNEMGFYGTINKGGNPWYMGWWRYRIPGRGTVDWAKVVDKLYEVGYTGTLSVEHEDPLWGGDPEKNIEGLRIAYNHLRPLIGSIEPNLSHLA